MHAASVVLIGFGILLVALGAKFLHAHYLQAPGNEELEWAGFGEHPFRTQKR